MIGKAILEAVDPKNNKISKDNQEKLNQERKKMQKQEQRKRYLAHKRLDEELDRELY